MYSHDLVLISYVTTEDEIGNPIKVPVENTILARTGAITANEFYQAATAEIKPEIKFIIHDFEYQGEKVVRYQDQEYEVIRTYTPYQRVQELKSEYGGRNTPHITFDEIELTCERKVG